MASKVLPHEAQNKYDFDVSGPQNLTSLGWRDIFSSSWKDANYKQKAISCFTRAAYSVEVDRQENRTQESALAPKWLIPFKYKLTQTLIDERDGSIFGAIFEWDQSAALADSVLIRPSGAPKAVLAIRGTLLRRPTVRRDLEDDARIFVLKSLKGSSRFKVAKEALKSVCDAYGSRNVCITGHSLGAEFALQLGKELAEEGIILETHLFNPPSVSLDLSFEYIGEQAGYVWNGLKFMFGSSSKAQVSYDDDKTVSVQLKSLIPCLSGLMDSVFGVDKWVPHVYVNNNDYICRFYNVPNDGTGEMIADKENLVPMNEEIAAKLFVIYKENQKFLEAHGLDQWWSSDAHSSKLSRRQLRSLNTASLLQATCLLYPPSVSLPISLQDFGRMAKFLWVRLSSQLHPSGKSQVSNDGENKSVICLRNWIPQLSGLKGAVFWVCNWVPCLYVWSFYTDPDVTREKIADKKRTVPTDEQIVVQLLAISKGKQMLLVAHGLEQWWPSEAELLQAIHNGKLISSQFRSLYSITPREVAHLFNPSSVSLAMILRNNGERPEFVWKWNSIKMMISSIGEAQVTNDADKTSGVRWKSWMPRVSGLKDACFSFGKWVPYLYSKIIDYISRQFRSFCYCKPSQVMHLFDVTSLSLATSLRNTGEMAEFVWNRLKSMLPLSSKAQVSNNDADMTSGACLKSWILLLFGFKDAVFGLAKWVFHLYVNKTEGIGEKMVSKENMGPTNGQTAAGLFSASEEKLKLLKFSSDAEFQQAIHNSKLISQQLRSLYNSTPWELTHLLNPSSVSLAMILNNIGDRPEFVWKWNSIKSLLSSSGKARVSNDADMTSGVSLKSCIPRSSGLKDAGFEVAKRAPHLHVNKTDGIVEKNVDKENFGPTEEQITAKSSVVSNETKEFLEAHGLWWSSGAELQQAIRISKLINSEFRSSYTSTTWQVTHLLNPPSISLAKSLIKAHGLEQCWSSDAVLKQAILNSKLISSQLRFLYTGQPSQATQGKP